MKLLILFILSILLTGKAVKVAGSGHVRFSLGKVVKNKQGIGITKAEKSYI